MNWKSQGFFQKNFPPMLRLLVEKENFHR